MILIEEITETQIQKCFKWLNVVKFGMWSYPLSLIPYLSFLIPYSIFSITFPLEYDKELKIKKFLNLCVS